MKVKSAEIETKEARKFVGSTRTVLRKEYKDAIEYLEPSAKVKLLCCAAKLIYLIERWGNWKITLYPLPQAEWIYLRLKDFRRELQLEHSIHCIRAAFKLLEKIGLVLIRKNGRPINDRNGQDRTFQYRLNRDRLNQVVALVAPNLPKSAQTHISSRIGNFDSHSGNPESHRFTVESHTQIPYTDSSTDSLSGASDDFENFDVATEVPQPTYTVITNAIEYIEVNGNYENQRETPLKQHTSHEDKYSAAPRGFKSLDERDNFYLELIELGKHKSDVRSVVSWSGAIMKSIAKGEPCIYLDEFRRGEKVGSCEKQEWEIAPGRPYDNFVTYLRRKLQPNYATIEQATQAAFKSIADVNQARILWNDYKNHLINLEQEWEKQRALGVTTPYIPAEVLPQKQVSVEQAAAAIANLVQASVVNPIAPEQTTNPEKAITTQETVSEEPAVVLEEAVSEEPVVTAQETVTEESVVIPEETEAEVERRQQVLGLIKTQNQLLKYPAGLGFVKMWVRQNSDLVQFNEDGIVVAIANEQEDVTVEAASGIQTDDSSTPMTNSESTKNNCIKVGDYVFVNSCPHTDTFAPFEVLEIDGEFAQIEMFPYPVRLSDLRLE